MKYEITEYKLQRNSFGKNDIVISKVKEMDDDGKYLRFAPLEEWLLIELQKQGAVNFRSYERK